MMLLIGIAVFELLKLIYLAQHTSSVLVHSLQPTSPT
jgi:hypothetical protein